MRVKPFYLRDIFMSFCTTFIKRKGRKKEKRDEKTSMVGKKRETGSNKRWFCFKDFGKLFKLDMGRLSRSWNNIHPWIYDLTTDMTASPQLSFTRWPRFSNWKVPGSKRKKFQQPFLKPFIPCPCHQWPLMSLFYWILLWTLKHALWSKSNSKIQEA